MVRQVVGLVEKKVHPRRKRALEVGFFAAILAVEEDVRSQPIGSGSSPEANRVKRLLSMLGTLEVSSPSTDSTSARPRSVRMPSGPLRCATTSSSPLDTNKSPSLFACPSSAAKRLHSLFERARRSGGEDDDGWVLYRIVRLAATADSGSR